MATAAHRFYLAGGIPVRDGSEIGCAGILFSLGNRPVKRFFLEPGPARPFPGPLLRADLDRFQCLRDTDSHLADWTCH